MHPIFRQGSQAVRLIGDRSIPKINLSVSVHVKLGDETVHFAFSELRAHPIEDETQLGVLHDAAARRVELCERGDD